MTGTEEGSRRFLECGTFAAARLLWGAVVCLALLVESSTVSIGAPSEFTLPPGAERVCLSMRVLSKRLSAVPDPKAVLPDECLNLGGIGFLEGYVLDDRGGGDVVLFGQRSSSRPSLRLDDLVANLRCIARAVDYPYCSLDPKPENIRALQRLLQGGKAVTSTSQIHALFEQLQSTIGPQQVVVGGVPRNSRHAHAMIDADYHMKKVSQGHITLPGVTSCLDRSLEAARAGFGRGGVAGGSVSMARFWFHVKPPAHTSSATQADPQSPPGSCYPSFREDEGIVLLEGCPVAVLTERQATSASGTLFDVAEDDPIALAFADEMTDAFPELCKVVPEYADLENLFRLRALLLAAEFRSSLTVIGNDFNSYLWSYKFQDERPIGPDRPGLANYREWSDRVTQGSTIYEYYVFPMVCGGVGMDMSVTEANFHRDLRGSLASVRRALLAVRPSPDALSWVVR